MRGSALWCAALLAAHAERARAARTTLTADGLARQAVAALDA